MSAIAKFALENPNAIKDMCDDLKKKIVKSAVFALNTVAFEARGNVVASIEKTFTLRNNFTTRQVQYTKANAYYKNVNSLKDINSKVGITEEAGYMALQDTGGYRTGKKGNLRIPTDKSRAGSSKSGKVQKKYHLGSLVRLSGEYKREGTSKSRAVARAYVAAKTGKVVNYGKNIFKISNFRKNGGNVSFDKQMIYEGTHDKTYVPGANFFMPACEKAAENIQKLFNDYMDKEFTAG